MYSLTIGLTYEETLKLEEQYRYDFLLFDCNLRYIGYNKISQFVFVFRTIKKYAKEDTLNNVLLDVIDYRNLNGAETAIHGDCHYHFIDTKDDIDESISLSENIEIVKRKNEFETTYYANIKNQTIVEQGHYGLEDSQPFSDVNVSYKLFTENNDIVINCIDIELPYIFKLQQDHIWHNNRSHNSRWSKIYLPDENKKDEELKKSLSLVRDAIEKESSYWQKQNDKLFSDLLDYRNNRLKYKVIER